jgi:exonuclease 3'-5' domain-containing protein 1
MLTITLISTASEVATMLSSLKDLPATPPSIYIDIEGAKLSRNGTISLLTIYILPTNTVYIVDIHNLGATAFSTSATPEFVITLKSILESPTIPKVFFDVRNDSDALFAHHAISLQGIHDLQLMELATRTRARDYINGLARCIQRDADLTFTEADRASVVKEAGTKLFAPKRGGSYDVFNERPLQAMVQEDCVQDVVHMPKLWNVYQKKMSEFWNIMVEEAGVARVENSQSKGYRPNDEGKKYGCFSYVVVAGAQRKWKNGQRKGLL